MDLQDELNDLSDIVNRVSCGVNAVLLMTMGLERASDPYADGFEAVCDYLIQTEQALQKQMKACMKAM